MFLHRSVCSWRGEEVLPTEGVCIWGGGSASKGRGSAYVGGLRPGEGGGLPTGGVHLGEGVCLQGGLPNLRFHPSPELERRAVRILLECFLVLTVKT